MATVCSFCGQALPRGGDARFCTHCGKPVPNSSSAFPDAQVAKNKAPLANNHDQSPRNPNLGWHEQLAKQPPVRSAQPQDSNVTPWVGLPGGGDASNITPWVGLPGGDDDSNVTPWAGLPEQDATPKHERMTAQSDFPAGPSTAKPSAQPETWQSQDIEELATLPFTTQNPSGSTSATASSLEDLPTSSMSTSSMSSDAPLEDLPTSSIPSAASVSNQSGGEQRNQQERQERVQRGQAEDVDQMLTSQWQSNVRPPQAYSSRPPMRQNEPASSPGNVSSMREPAGVTLDGRHFGTQAAGVQAPLRARRKQKRSWLVGVIAAVVLLLLAFGCWIILAQPFSVSANTDPSQTTSSAPLGLTITYPTGWTAAQSATTLTLADSSATAQMKIVQSASGNSDQTSYLKQQAAKLGMTDAKAGATISFAGSSWQQTHGDFVIDGANYSGNIYVTTHNNQLYTLTQIAPKITFQDEESLVFAPARASLKFK